MSMENETAIVSHLPSFSGDGYGWGGGAVITIGDRSISLGEGHIAYCLAQELAARWNACEEKMYREEEILF